MGGARQPACIFFDRPSSSLPKPTQTATFGQPSATECGPYDYTRTSNPTRAQLESQFAAAEGGVRGVAFTSGMAALAACLRLAPAGSHVVAGDDLYGGTSRLLARVAPDCGLEVTLVDTSGDPAAFEAALRPGSTSLVLLESPTNPRMRIADIKTLCAASKKAGAISVVDNSIMTALHQRPLALGADVSMTSATKFVGGHSDVTAGLLAVSDAALGDRLAFYQNAEGAGLSPFDSWLCLRGLKTMHLRMTAAAANAATLAAFLDGHPLVESINYPGLPHHPGAATHAAQSTSAGALLSFTTGDVAISKTVVESTRLFNVAVSFGSVASQISLPCYMSHASIPAADRAARGLPDDLVRISTGVEDVGDLVRDLEHAFSKAAAVAGRPPPPADRGAAILAAAATGREAALTARVAQLEAELERVRRGAAAV